MAAPAPPAAAAAPPPLVLDVHADTLDHVVRAVARSGFLPEAVRLMLASPEHVHDPELLYRTRNVRGYWGNTLLMRAVWRLNVARAGEILDACPTPASRAELLACVCIDGAAALHIACCANGGDEEAALRLAELLLANGADVRASRRDPDDEDDEVWHAIHLAATWSVRLVQRLVQAGASIDGDLEGDSTLIWAAAAGTAQGVRMIPRLVALGARETLGNKAMRVFVQRPAKGAQPSHAEVVAALNALVSVGCSLTQSTFGRTPLDALVSVGCSLTQSTYGRTPLDDAALRGNAPVVRALLSLGAPATTSSLAYGVMHPAIIRVLLAAGALPDALVDLGGGLIRSPLIEAARESALESVEALLAAGASVGLPNHLDQTALTSSVAGSTFDPRVTEALLAAGADVNARDNEGWTALHYLAAHQAQQPWAAGAARLLLQRGADARAVNNAGFTPAECVPVAQRSRKLYRLLEAAAA